MGHRLEIPNDVKAETAFGSDRSLVTGQGIGLIVFNDATCSEPGGDDAKALGGLTGKTIWLDRGLRQKKKKKRSN